MHATVVDFRGESTTCGREQARALSAERVVVLHRVDQRLRMFNSHTDGKRLLLKEYALRVECFVNISGGVASREDDFRAKEFAVICGAHTLDRAV